MSTRKTPHINTEEIDNAIREMLKIKQLEKITCSQVFKRKEEKRYSFAEISLGRNIQ